MNALGSVEAVVAAIREEARDEVERIELEAAAAITRLRDEDAARPVTVADADARVADARRRARERLAQEDWTDRQSALNAREAWLRAVVDQATTRLGGLAIDDRRASLLRLAREAIEQLGADSIELTVGADDLPLVDDQARRALLAATGRTIAVRAGSVPIGGCIAQTADGRLRVDNSYGGRLQRLEPQWRQQLGELFARAGIVHA